MSPLIEYLGNVTPQDNTASIGLAPDPKTGEARSIAIGGRALVSGDELRTLASLCQIKVVEDGDEKDNSVIPTEMPDGYDDNGYQEDEAPTAAVFTAEAYPDDEDVDLDVDASQSGVVATEDAPATSTLSSAAPAGSSATPAPAAATTSGTSPVNPVSPASPNASPASPASTSNSPGNTSTSGS
jgi:hypothetical protein